MTAEGHERVSRLPRMMADDLAISEIFESHERQVCADAVVIVRLPRTLPDLMRRRIRVATGNGQVDRSPVAPRRRKTMAGELVRIVMRNRN